MRLWIILSTVILVATARPKSKEDSQSTSKDFINEGIDCPESRLNYFVTVRVEPLASAIYKVDDVDESKCRQWCSKNENPTQKSSANCSSYSYNDETRRCKLYSGKTYPDGVLERKVTPKPKRLFEKYCMPEKLAIKCGKVDFTRVDEMLLSGFAQSTAMFRTMAECMNHCIEETEFVCKSAMYFYEEGECITNVETMTNNNALIHVEDDDRVVFLQNDCAIKAEEATQKPTTIQTTTTTELPSSTTQSSTTTESTTQPSTTTVIAKTTIQTTKLVEVFREQEQSMGISIPKGPIALKPEKEKKAEVVSSSSIEESKEKKSEEVKQELYGAKILKTDGVLNEPTEDLSKSNDFGLAKPSKQAAPDSIKVTKTNNVLNEFKLASSPGVSPSSVSEDNRYFTAWSNWSPCTNVGERRVRRRKCLDFKKCRGRLTEVDYCPPELIIREESIEDQPDEDSLFASGPIGPTRQPLPVAKSEGESESGSPPSILPPQLPKKEAEVLPDGAPGSPEDIWSPWLGVCQNFASTQPCKNGQIIGFESRECIAKDPKNCKGPFFRYCTLPC